MLVVQPDPCFENVRAPDLAQADSTKANYGSWACRGKRPTPARTNTALKLHVVRGSLNFVTPRPGNFIELGLLYVQPVRFRTGWVWKFTR